MPESASASVDPLPQPGRRSPARSAAGSRSSPRGHASRLLDRLRGGFGCHLESVPVRADPGTCACARPRRRSRRVIMPRHARLPDRPLGSAHGGDRNRRLRRHRDRFRAQLPAVAQRRGRDAVGGLARLGTRRAGRRHQRPPRPAAALPGRCTRRWCCATTCWGCACPRRCSASSPSRSPTASVASCWADPAAPCWRCWSRPRRRWCTSPSSRAATPPCWPPPSAACGCCCCCVRTRRARYVAPYAAVGAAAGGRAPVRPVRPGVGDGAAGGAGPGAAAARLARRSAATLIVLSLALGAGLLAMLLLWRVLLAAAAQVRRRPGRAGGRPRVVASSGAGIGDAWTGSSYVDRVGWRWPPRRWPGS